MSDSKLDKMAREEKVRWLKSRGPAGGTLNEFRDHLVKLMRTDSEWRAVADEKLLDEIWDAYFDKAGHERKSPKRIKHESPSRPKASNDARLVHIHFATVGDMIADASLMARRAKTKAERVYAERLTDAADIAKERAGGDLDMKLRDLRDQVWPASDTRQ